MPLSVRSACGVAVLLGVSAAAKLSAAAPTTPAFFARRDYPTAPVVTFTVQVADTNGDGIPDLIELQHSDIAVLFGNGNGAFTPGPLSPLPADNNYPPGIGVFATGDFNGDGNIDIVWANEDGVDVALGKGNGMFRIAVGYSVKDGNVYNLAIGDFNGDGILDVVATGSSGVWLMTGVGNGTFNSAVLEVPLPGAYNIAAADFNQDGILDLAVTTPNDATGTGIGGAGTAVLLGNGNGSFQTPRMLSEPAYSTALAVGPLIKGGPPGIAVNTASSSDVYLFFGNGKGEFEGPKAVNLPGVTLNGLAIGDVVGNGIPDLVAKSGYVAYGVGGGEFSKPVNYPVEGGGQLANVVIADLRNNGLKDIITGNYDAISVLLNVGKGLIEDGAWTAVAGGATCGVAADFNGDGKPDLAVNTGSGVSILLGTGRALSPFSAGADLALTSAGCAVTGDLNGDGIADLLIPTSGSVVAYLGNGNGTFRLASTTSAPSPGFVVLADFNRDGKLDFATSGNLIALGNGDGTFQAPTAILAGAPSGEFSGIAAGDINNDGWPDLVLGGAYPASEVLLNNHEGGFTQAPGMFVGTEPILADLNGDGNLDLVAWNLGVTIALGNGSGAFTPQNGLPVSTGGIVSPIYIADVNGDGILDILVSEWDSLGVYLGQGDATYPSSLAVGTGPDPASILVENLHGQSPTSGVPDIVVPDTSGGVMVLPNFTP